MSSAFSVDNIFGDHMVLQRGRPIRISGSAPRGMTVKASLGDGMRSGICEAGEDGRWAIEMEPLPAGGPFALVVSTMHSRMVFTDILVGDVWFCSGQSNMEYPLCGPDEFFHLPEGKEVAGRARDDRLRLLSVPNSVSPEVACTDNVASPAWRAATSRENVESFSAVAYLFGRRLRESLPGDVPVGLIDSSWGGTRIEPWIPRKGLEASGQADALRQLDAIIAAYEESASEQRPDGGECYGGPYREWIEGRFRKYAPDVTARAMAEWRLPEDDSQEWGDVELARIPDSIREPGAYWMRCRFKFPAGMKGARAVFHADSVDDSDIAFLDGVKIGETSPFTFNYWMLPRDYAFPVPDDGEGVHTIAVRLENHYCTGTFTGHISILGDDGTLVDLAALPWQTRTEFIVDPERIGVRPDIGIAGGRMAYYSQQTPSTLFNAMVAPATAMNIRGAVWYQGCNNASEWRAYGGLQEALITSWRSAWRDPGMPFVLTQLSGFWQHTPQCRGDEGFWREQSPGDTVGFAPMREVQQRFLDFPNTGVACTIDVGDAFDIHPPRKGPVAERLAHEAMRLAYGVASSLPGPRGTSARVIGNSSIEVAVEDTGDGLRVDGGAIGPHLAAVKYRDGATVWCDAAIGEDGRSLVFAADRAGDVREVQYAFSAYAPGPFVLRKGDGLPLFPFSLFV